tara:strand:+ start:11457 stop:12347 length:891 start_codon:yes stop_codon:yes gene_type:complete
MNIEDYEIHIFEPFSENICTNLKKIKANKEDFLWYKNLNDLPLVDIAIVATSSSPRFKIVKFLIKSGCKKILLEKIIFQSEAQFEAIQLLAKKNRVKIYCNFVNRYFDAYNIIKNKLIQSSLNIKMIVHGSNFNLELGCNAIHYIDIFQYLTRDNEIELKKFNTHLLRRGNRRGSIYKEFAGKIELSNTNGDTINISSEVGIEEPVTISISQGNKKFLLNEDSGKLYTNSKAGKIASDFTIVPSSILTKVIVQDIIKSDCRLTTLDQTLLAHTSLFKAFNNVLNNNHTTDTLCPIT